MPSMNIHMNITVLVYSMDDSKHSHSTGWWTHLLDIKFSSWLTVDEIVPSAMNEPPIEVLVDLSTKLSTVFTHWILTWIIIAMNRLRCIRVRSQLRLLEKNKPHAVHETIPCSPFGIPEVEEDEKRDGQANERSTQSNGFHYFDCVGNLFHRLLNKHNIKFKRCYLAYLRTYLWISPTK